MFAQNKSWEHYEDDFSQVHGELFDMVWALLESQYMWSEYK